MSETPESPVIPKYFSIVCGGPLYSGLLRLRLIQAPVERAPRRAILLVLIAWLPLLILSLVEGHAWGSEGQVGFFKDLSAHARFLIAIPLFIMAERLAHLRMLPVVQQFSRRGIIGEADQPAYETILAKVAKLIGSRIPEIVFLILAYTVGHVIWKQTFSPATTAWYGSGQEGRFVFTKAGLWYGWVSLPFFRFLLYRWLYRLGVWAFFLYKVSRLDLHLVPSHPDRAGGLGFLNQVTGIFLPLILAWGCLLSGLLGTQMIFEGFEVQTLKYEGGGILVFVALLVLAPLLFFTPVLLRTKRVGSLEFGVLGARYTRDFEGKWVHGGAGDEPLLGTGDIQSLADLANSLAVVASMRFTVISRNALIMLVATLALPCLPLVLLVIPLKELVPQLIKFIL
jgi:hypothetical protein